MTTIPEQYLRSTVPHLFLDGAAEAISFYEKAFGADELFRLPDDGRPIVHAEMVVEGSVFMLSDAHDGFSSLGAAADAAGLTQTAGMTSVATRRRWSRSDRSSTWR